ncbi:MAG: 5-bromo-4-chloroindolyl phosphate hydrolysis family protein [Thermomicrobiales bacterium]
MTDMQSAAEQSARKRAKDLRAFMQHLGAFFSFGLFLLLINLLTNPHSLWFFWPLLPWGVGLAIHGWSVLWNDRFFGDSWEERHVEKTLARRQGKSSSSSDPDPGASADMRQVTDQASALVDTMRASVRRIPDPDVRRRALDACAASDQALAAIMEHPEEMPLARDFVNRFLEPASKVMSDYSSLANRNVPSARETLTEVEQHDLPLITRKANDLYDRLHRGTLIDLEVAREMLTLDMPDA